MLELFETMRLEKGTIHREAYHQARMKKSSVRLGFDFDRANWDTIIQTIISAHPKGTFRVRVALSETGQMTYKVLPLPQKQTFTAALRQRSSRSKVWQITNKTSSRDFLAHDHQTDIVLFYDEAGKVLEFDIGNVMIKEQDVYYTPTYDADLLQGCMRQEMLDQGRLIEKDIDVETLRRKIKTGEIEIFMINSLRMLAEVEIYL